MWFQDFVSSSAVYINEITHEPVYNKRERNNELKNMSRTRVKCSEDQIKT